MHATQQTCNGSFHPQCTLRGTHTQPVVRRRRRQHTHTPTHPHTPMYTPTPANRACATHAYAGTKHAATTSVSRMLFDADPDTFFAFEPDSGWDKDTAAAQKHAREGPGVRRAMATATKHAELLDVLWCNATLWGGWGRFGGPWWHGSTCQCMRPFSHCSADAVLQGRNATERCRGAEACGRLQRRCEQARAVSFKSILFDGHLGDVVDRYCHRQDFAARPHSAVWPPQPWV